jgi:antitoxin Phd
MSLEIAILMAMKAVSIAEAKNRLPELVHEAERRPIEITRRGRPVAVLVSSEAWSRAQRKTGGAWQRLESFRARHDLRELDVASVLEGVRAQERPRKFRW